VAQPALANSGIDDESEPAATGRTRPARARRRSVAR